MTDATEESQKLKQLAENVLKSMYGLFNVWNITIFKISKKEGIIRITGGYGTDINNVKTYDFIIELDEEYRLVTFERLER